MEQSGSKSGKEYIKAAYCHPAYLTFMQSTSWEMLDWWSTSWNQDFQEKYQNLRYADYTTHMAENEDLKSLLMKMKEESEKVGLTLNIQKTKIMAPDPSLHANDGETMKTVIDFIFLAPKSMLMVTATMKLKDACSLEEKLWPI